MMKKILTLLFFVSTASMNVYANDVADGYTESNKATSYVKCGLYAEIANIYKDNGSNIPEENAATFRLLALKHWRRANMLMGNPSSGDDEVIGFATYLSSQESVTWDDVPDMNKSTNNGMAAIAAYHKSNCTMLLDVAKQ